MTLSTNTSRSPLALSLLGALSLACSSEGVDLGGGVRTQDQRRGTRCAETTIVDENVRVTNQAELAALEGCEELRGTLSVQMFADADLSPLHALRDVRVQLELGSSQADTVSLDEPYDEALAQQIEEREAPLRGSWLTSLAGLESLEHVGALAVQQTGLTDLGPLAGLRSIGGDAGGSGTLRLYRNPALVDLAGLENASGITLLDIYSSPALESLAGVSLSDYTSYVSITDAPQLTDIGALSTVTTMEFLNLDHVGMTNLDALSGLSTAVEGLFVLNSPALVDASGLRGLTQTLSLLFSDNPLLKVLPSFQSYYTVPDLITIERNAALEEIEIDASFALAPGFNAGARSRAFSSKLILVNDNPTLERVAFGPTGSDGLGLGAAQIVAFERNPSLARIDFGGLQRADVLVINDNAALSDVTIGQLATVDTLELTGNPSLDSSVFDTVRSFERVESAEPSAVPSY
jgi:hypothetical protein